MLIMYCAEAAQWLVPAIRPAPLGGDPGKGLTGHGRFRR
jgi:hypothetical protein